MILVVTLVALAGRVGERCTQVIDAETLEVTDLVCG